MLNSVWQRELGCGDIYHRVCCIRRVYLLTGEITSALLLSKVKQQVQLERIRGSGLAKFVLTVDCG
jgi:hypothetical protein